MRTFDSFNYEDIHDLFKIKRNDTIPLLTEWTSAIDNSTPFEKENLQRLKKHLFKQILAWNEDELKIFFIGPLIELANLETDDFKPFSQRSLSAIVDSIEVGGRVDFMIAKGLRTAKPPYFCIHEYKQEIGSDGDPLGQVLIAMLASQVLNKKEFPILGAYILGRNWFFIVLENREYAVSMSYDATSEDIFQIFAILQKSKEIIQRYI